MNLMFIENGLMSEPLQINDVPPSARKGGKAAVKKANRGSFK